MRKEDTELLEKLNHAISEMNLNTPSWRETFQQKYFTNQEEEALVFDKAELEYLQELKDSRIRFKVVTNPDLAPYSSLMKREMLWESHRPYFGRWQRGLG